MTHSKSILNAFTQISLAAMMLFALALPAAAQTVGADADPLTRLMKGNERYVSGRLQAKDYRAERPGLMQGQNPYAVVLACADSHVPPEIVFDESIGRLYVVRTAGHVLDPVALGSIEYAVEHFGAKLLFVLGHEGCNAVKAAIGGGAELSNVKVFLNRLQPAVDKSRAASLSEPQLLKRVTMENVRYQMQKALFGSDLLAELVQENKLKISGGVYNLLTGAVAPLNSELAVHRTSGQPNNNAHAAAAHSPSSHAPAAHAAAPAHAPAAHATTAHGKPATPAAQSKTAAHAPAAHDAHAPAAHDAHAPAAHDAHAPAAHDAHAPAAHDSHAPAAHDAHAPAATSKNAHAPAATPKNAHAPAASSKNAHAPAAHDTHAPAAHDAHGNDAHGHDAHPAPAKHSTAPAAAPTPNAKKAVHKPAAHDAHTDAHGDSHAAPAPKTAPKAAHKEEDDGHGKPHGAPAPASKNTHTDAHSSLHPPQRMNLDNLEKTLQTAYAAKKELVVKKPALMRDNQDRCATDDCRKIEAGEKVKLESPTIVSVSGRPQIKVRYKGKPYYILAEADTLAFSSH